MDVNENPFWAKTWELFWMLMSVVCAECSQVFFPLIFTRGCYPHRTWSGWLRCGWTNTQSTYTSADQSTGIFLQGTSQLRRNFATTSTAKASSGSWTRSRGTCRSFTHQWSLQQLLGERQVCALKPAVDREAAVWFFKVALPMCSGTVLLWVRWQASV